MRICDIYFMSYNAHVTTAKKAIEDKTAEKDARIAELETQLNGAGCENCTVWLDRKDARIKELEKELAELKIAIPLDKMSIILDKGIAIVDKANAEKELDAVKKESTKWKEEYDILLKDRDEVRLKSKQRKDQRDEAVKSCIALEEELKAVKKERDAAEKALKEEQDFHQLNINIKMDYKGQRDEAVDILKAIQWHLSEGRHIQNESVIHKDVNKYLSRLSSGETKMADVDNDEILKLHIELLSGETKPECKTTKTQ
jgi:hypothetical protein